MTSLTYRWDLRDEEHEEDDDEESGGAVRAPLAAVPATRVRVLAAVLTTATAAVTVRLSVEI